MGEDSTDDVRRRVRRIIQTGQRMPPTLHGEIIELGAAAIPALIEILENRELSLAKSPGDGWAPTHAASLLGELNAVEAIEPMLRVLADTEPLELLHDAVIQALPEIGAAVVEPALRAHAESGDNEFRQSVASILASTGVRDDRILTVLLDHLRNDAASAAGDLAQYGDERALPDLSRAFDEYEVRESDSPLANQDLVELDAAIEELGGALSKSQREKLHRANEPAERWRRAMDARAASTRGARPGRNEPCWCGSTKKYKKCHLAADERGEIVASPFS